MYRPSTTSRTQNNSNNNIMLSRTSTPVSASSNNVATPRNGNSTSYPTTTTNNNNSQQQQVQQHPNINISTGSFGYIKADENSSLTKPVLVVARVRDFAPLEDPSRRAVFVTGQRTCFVQLPHQRGKIDFLVDAVIGGSGENDIDPRSGDPYYHPQIHHRPLAEFNNAKTAANPNFGYDYHARHPNVISSPKSSAFVGAGSQESVFDAVGVPLVDCMVQGRNATILTYGATASGKTFTSFGPPDSLGTPLEGLIPRMARGIFDACNSAQGFFHTNVSVTILEVFLEDVYDLLDPARPKLKLRGDTTKGFAPIGETCVRVTSYDQICVLLADAEKRRTTLDVSQHHRSSRSHVLFFLHLQRFMANGSEVSSKLLVADLAGSERTHHKDDPNNSMLSHLYQHEQAMKFESAISINMSLLALGSVIEAAASRDGHVTQQQVQRDAQTLLPEFRRSALTKLMKDHIGGNSRTVVLVTVSPATEGANNSIQALRFGQRAMKVRTHSRINLAIRGPAATFGNNNNNNSNAKVVNTRQPQIQDQDPVLEKLRAKMNKRKALIEVECTLEEELCMARRKVQQLENDLCRSPFDSTNGNNNNNSTLQIITSDILEMRARELEQAIAEESRIERDLFTLFDCPPTENNIAHNKVDFDDFVNDDNIEAEECTLFAVVRKRHEAELNDVRAQAWKTSGASPQRTITKNSGDDNPSSPSFTTPTKKENGKIISPATDRRRNNTDSATSPMTRNNLNSTPRNNNNNNNRNTIMTSPTSPSREQLEKLLADANEEIEQLRERVADREDKSAKLAQKLLLTERNFIFRSDLDYIEQRQELLARNSIEIAQVKFWSELKSSHLVDRTRLEYFGQLRKSMLDESKERTSSSSSLSFGGERERQLKRELEDARQEARKFKDEAEGAQIKLEIAETERRQFAKESDTRWTRVVELEHLVEILKNENGQLKHHAEVLKTHFEHQVNLQDLQHERLKNDTQMSLQRFRFEGERTLSDMKHNKGETAVKNEDVKLEERLQNVEKGLIKGGGVGGGSSLQETKLHSDSRDTSQNRDQIAGMTDSLSTSQLSTVNRYYATILAERERLNHMIAADEDSSASPQKRQHFDASTPSIARNTISSNNINMKNISEPEYFSEKKTDSVINNNNNTNVSGYRYPTSMTSYQQQQQPQSRINNTVLAPTPSISINSSNVEQEDHEYKNYYVAAERLKLLEQQLVLEQQRAEQKRQLSEQQHHRQPSYPVHHQNSSRQPSLATNQYNNNTITTTNPRYSSETISSQNRSYHSFDPIPANANANVNNSNNISSLQTRGVSPSWTSIQNNAAHQIYRGNSTSMARPGNVSQDNVIGSPKYHAY